MKNILEMYKFADELLTKYVGPYDAYARSKLLLAVYMEQQAL